MKNRIANEIPIVGRENENHWALHGDTYMKGAWVMHTFRSVINNDKIWFEILKEFMVENAKGFADTNDFFKKVNDKTGVDYWYFAQQYFYSPNQPILEYYQTDKNFILGGIMLMKISVCQLIFYKWETKRFNPSKDFKSFDISKHSQVEVMDWRFYVLPKRLFNE